MHTPFVHLKAQYCAHRTKIDVVIATVIDGTALTDGEFGVGFEKACAGTVMNFYACK